MNDPYLQTFSKQHNTLHKISPISFVRASKQYLYDDQGVKYLDCISNISHVGHCHPRVVDAARIQMSKMTTSVGLLCETQVRYIKRLVETLPEQLCVCFLVNSGSEANDIALRLARSYTGNEDVVVIDKAYYGALSSLVDISPYKFGNSESKEGVQVVPLPDTYRGLYREEHHNVGELYALDAEKVVARALLKGRKIACFISEPIIVSAGVIIPPKNYLKHIYSYIRGIGGVCIADEVQSGLSRTGEHFWAFQSHDVVPDIVTVGRPLGNGHPMAAVFTTREIGDKLTDFVSSFGGNPVSCAIGSAVLDVMYNEKLMLAAKCVGQCLMEELKKLKTRHTCIGDIRGLGMLIGVEFVSDQAFRKPDSSLAADVCERMTDERIVVALQGENMNVLVLSPPLCFTVENSRHFGSALDKVLTAISKGEKRCCKRAGLLSTERWNIPAEIVCPENFQQNSTSTDLNEEPVTKRHHYEDMD